MNSICLTHGYADGHYVLPPLPYGVRELEPLVGSETMLLHHDKHHAAYVAGANEAADALKKINNGTLSPDNAAGLAQKLAFNLGGHLLHTLYWHNLIGSPQGLPQGELALAVERSFGGFDAFCRLFATVAETVPGSGWAVMGIDPVSRLLIVCAIKRHEDALVPGFVPLLACDVWEHAYYLNWKNNRKGYVASFMQHINWENVEELFETSYSHEC